MGVLCPKESCNKEFDTDRGMKIHHTKSHGESIAFDSVECYWCGDTVNKRVSEIKRVDKYFCDEKCKQKEFGSRQSGENNPRWSEDSSKNTHTCEFCGDFYKNYKSSENTKCCSRECYKNWMSENLVGENAPSWSGGRYFYYGPSWQKARRNALSNASYKCEECGLDNNEHIDEYDQSLHVHHIKKFKKFGLENHLDANREENLMVVCRDCHYKVES